MTTQPNLRSGSAPFERTANATQRRLVATYLRWSIAVRRELFAISENGGQPSRLSAHLRTRLPLLQTEIQTIMRAGVQAATNVGIGRTLARTPAAQNIQRSLNASNFALIETSLIPDIGNGLSTAFETATVEIDVTFLANSFAVFTARVAQFAGGAWVAIFEVQRRVGQELEEESGDIRPVRWNLNERADHCSDSGTHHGCPDLARTYDGGWSELVTVPAGQVTCRGNCRCFLTVFKGGEWVRGL